MERATRGARCGFPSTRTRFPPCGAAGSARDSGSRGRRFDPCRGDQTSALGCGRSSTAEPWAVNPLVPVRLRPVTPKRISLKASRTRAAENRALTPEGQGSSPWRRTNTPRGGIRQTHRSQKPAPRGMSVRLGPGGPQSGSSVVERRPHKAQAGGSFPPRTTRT
jgi:hypothetical protein